MQTQQLLVFSQFREHPGFFSKPGFASLKRYIDFARSSDVRLHRMVAEIDIIASLIKRMVSSLANFLKRPIYSC